MSKTVTRDPLLCWDRQRIRDVPRSCVCTWSWGPLLLRWVRIDPRPSCPWHSAPQPEVQP